MPRSGERKRGNRVRNEIGGLVGAGLPKQVGPNRWARSGIGGRMIRVREAAETSTGTQALPARCPVVDADKPGLGAFRFWLVVQRWECYDVLGRLHGSQPETIQP